MPHAVVGCYGYNILIGEETSIDLERICTYIVFICCSSLCLIRTLHIPCLTISLVAMVQHIICEENLLILNVYMCTLYIYVYIYIVYTLPF